MSKPRINDPQLALERLSHSSDTLGTLHTRLASCRGELDALTTELASQIRRLPSPATATSRPRSKRA